MIANTNKKVICIRNIPSNIIEEAIFVLKGDGEKPDEKATEKTKTALVMDEANELIRNYSSDFYKEQVAKKERKIKNKKIKIVLGICMTIILCIILAIIL